MNKYDRVTVVLETGTIIIRTLERRGSQGGN